MSIISENYRSYSKLAQIYNALRNNFTFQHIIKILSKEGDINYKIPSHSSLKSFEQSLAGGTAFHIAFTFYNYEVFEALLRMDTDYTIKNDHGLSALHYIIGKDFHSLSNSEKLRKKPFIDAILSEHVSSKNIVNPRNNDGLSHVHIACMTNHVEAVKFFLSNEEDVNHTVNKDASCNPGYSALHFAVKFYATETVKLLLEFDANVFLKDSRGMTPLHLLLERKLQIYDSTDMDKEVEFITTMQDEIAVNDIIVNLLLEKISCDNFIIDDSGLSRFHIACTLHDTSAVEQILEKVDNIDHAISTNSQIWPGYSGLHFATYCNVNTVNMLLTRGADFKKKDIRGISPFDICLERFKVKDIRTIVSHQHEWKDIVLSDGKTKLIDLLYVMENSNRLKIFLQSSQLYINTNIPANSQLWPGYTPLHLAVTLSERHKRNISGDYSNESNDFDLVEACLVDGADVTIKDSRGWTALNLAYRQNKMRTVSLLLQCHHVLINPVDEDNLSHLHIACEAQNIILVENLLLRTGDVNIVYKGSVPVRSIKSGYTPLHVAVARKNLKVAEILMKYGADINAIDFDGNTPIHETFYFDNYEKIAKLLFSRPEILRECVVNNIGLSNLHVASKYNDVDVVERLLQLGADIDNAIITSNHSRIPDRYKGCTALHVAVMCHTLDVVIFLLERGADILAKNYDGFTPLSKALDEKNRNYFRYFIPILKSEEDLQIRMEKETGITMLHIACHLVDVDVVKNCLNKGATVNSQIHKNSAIWAGCTPLHILLYKELECISKHNEELHKKILTISAILLKGGTDMTLPNEEGDTSIHISFKINDERTRYLRVRELLKCHTDFRINPINSGGLSHFHLACMVNEIKAVEAFLQSGIDVNLPIDFFSDKNPGCSPLHIAIDPLANQLFGYVTQLAIVDLLLEYGADVRAHDSYGYSALHRAARVPTQRVQVVDRILRAGANVNSESIYCETPFEILLLTDEITVEELQFFVQRDARINSCNPNSDKGYLSMLFSKNHHTNPQTAAVEVMISAPDIIKVNEMGRTAVHNAVTTAKPNISIEDYIQLIKRLTILGCDIDDQDKLGCTALHLAAQFGNKEATIALLTSGVDVNIIDRSNKSAFSYAVEICKKCDDTPNHRHTDVIQTIALHIHKLQILELDVSQLNANLKKAICPRINIEEKFQEEVEVVRELEIAHTSLFAVDFLWETKTVMDYPYMSQMDRNNVDEFFESINNYKIEQLKGILMLQYRKAVTRFRSIEPAIVALRSLLGFPLPQLCCEMIFKFLRNVDLKNLIVSASDDM